MRIGIIADDLTGATDSGAQLARAGYRVAVAFHDAQLPPSEDLDAVVVDTDSRQLDPESSRHRVSEVARQLKHVRIFYKKIDSTLRGQLTTEIEAALRESGRPGAIIAPAFPGNDRTTLKGVQLVHDEAVHETKFAKDPVTPVREGHIPSLLAAAGLSDIGTLDVGDLGVPERAEEVLGKYRWAVADAADDTHLRSLVEAVPDPAEFLWVGSAGLVKALGEVYPGPWAGVDSCGEPKQGGRVLVVVGSMSEVSREQLRRLDGEPAAEILELSANALVNGDSSLIESALREAGKSLKDGKSVALSSTSEEVTERDAGRIVESLAKVVDGLSEQRLFDALVLTGGDTAVHVSRKLSARGIMLKGEIEAGVATGTLIGPQPYRVITKAGGFGTPETLLHALHELAGEGEQL